MKILLSSPRPNVASLYRQFVTELAREHEVAVVSRHALYQSLFAEIEVQTYDPWALEDVAQSRIQSLASGFKDSPLETWAIQGVNLWEASTLIRQRHAMLNDPETPRQVLVRALANAVSALTFLADFKPDVMVVWNGHSLENYLYAAFASRAGAQTRFMERGLLPNALVLDQRGVNARSILCTEAKNASASEEFSPEDQQCVRQYLDDLRSAGQSVVRQPTRVSSTQLRRDLHLPEGARIIFVPAQIEWDSNILLNCPNFKTNRDVLCAVEKELIQRKDYYLVFKTHPEDPNRIKDLSSDRIRVAETVNLHALLDEAELVVTRNSTVGLEAVARGRSVMVLGRAIYSQRGFTYDVDASTPLAAQLDKALKEGFTPSMQTEAHRFFGTLLKSYLYFLDGNEVFSASNRTLLHAHFPAQHSIAPQYDDPPVPASCWLKAQKKFNLGLSTVTQDRKTMVQWSGGRARRALVVRFCAKKFFLKVLKAVSHSNLAERYVVLPRAPDLCQASESISGVTRVIEHKSYAWLEGLRARFGFYDLIIFLHDNALHVSKRVTCLRKGLAPFPVLGLDVGWADYLLDPHRAPEGSA